MHQHIVTVEIGYSTQNSSLLATSPSQLIGSVLAASPSQLIDNNITWTSEQSHFLMITCLHRPPYYYTGYRLGTLCSNQLALVMNKWIWRWVCDAGQKKKEIERKKMKKKRKKIGENRRRRRRLRERTQHSLYSQQKLSSQLT